MLLCTDRAQDGARRFMRRGLAACDAEWKCSPRLQRTPPPAHATFGNTLSRGSADWTCTAPGMLIARSVPGAVLIPDVHQLWLRLEPEPAP